MTNLDASIIGAAVAESLKNAAAGSVVGVTSKGVFLRAADKIMFLTPADYRSPFNLTLSHAGHCFERLAPGDPFTIDDDRIVFSSRQMTVQTARAEIWLPPLPAPVKTFLAQQQELAGRIARKLRQMDAGKGYLFLSQPLEEITPGNHLKVYHTANDLVACFKKQDREGFMAASGLLLGAGGGLTPSGDDFLAGFFLYHFRHDQAAGRQRVFLAEWCDVLTGLAFEKTTTISANRLLFSARGWSEELFLHLIDHLFDPAIPFDDDLIRLLMEFGHSSGVDTFMGISYAVASLS